MITLLMNGVILRVLLYLTKKTLKLTFMDITIKNYYLIIRIQENGNLEMNFPSKILIV